MKKTKIPAICLMITLVSFLGFAVENIWLALTQGYMDNRSMNLPFLVGYGLAIIAIYLMFGTPSKPRLFNHHLETESKFARISLYFLSVCICVSLGECLLGTFVEKTSGIVWWNYTDLPLNITKYTSVITTSLFGILITVFMGIFFQPVYNRFLKINKKVSRALSAVMMTLLIYDFFSSAGEMYRTGRTMTLWRVDL